MNLDRLTKAQLIEKLNKEERLTSQLEVELEETRKRLEKAQARVSELEQISAEALQTAQRASRAAETFRYSVEKEEKLAGAFAQTSRGLVTAMDVLTESNVIRGGTIRNLQKLFSPVTICPQCGHVRQSEEHDVLLCDKCLAARTKPSGQV